MALLLDPIETRIDAVMTAARGTGGGFTPLAQSLAIPTGWYRRVPGGASVRDEALELAAFDRSYSVDWTSIADDPDPGNLYDTNALRMVRFDLVLGFLYGADHAEYIHRAPSISEPKALVLPAAKRRALSEAERVYRALSFGEIVQGTDIDPQIVAVWRDGPSTIEDLRGGRLVCTTPYRVQIYAATAGSYAPVAETP
jgi:hypothetical protein